MPNENQKQFSVNEDKPTEWFEDLYAESTSTGEGVPWANMETHPSFKRWLGRNTLDGQNKIALVIGCGMGDDAIALEHLGFDVTAFDVSETAIRYCRERFPESSVNFLQADLLQQQKQWHNKFDFVLEIYTIQALPPKYETTLIRNISNFVAPGGRLLVIAGVSQQKRTFDKGPPWLLTSEHLDAFVSCGLDIKQTDIERDDSVAINEGTYITEFIKTIV